MRPVLALNFLLQIEQERSEEENSVDDALALAFRCARFCSASLINFALYSPANRVDPDQTPRSAASDLGQHCLPLSLLWEAGLKWVNVYQAFTLLLLLSLLFLMYIVLGKMCSYV